MISVGEKYKIYEDPKTKLKYEGTGKIVSVGDFLENGLYRCQVKFSIYENPCSRIVDKDDKIER